MKRQVLILAGLSLCAAAPALSAQRPVKALKLPTPCTGFSNSQQASVCYSDQRDAATKSLDATITDIKTKGKFDPDSSLNKTFDSAHDFWLKEMNLTCNAVGKLYEGGTLATSEPIYCQWQMTKAREQLLRDLYRSVLKN